MSSEQSKEVKVEAKAEVKPQSWADDASEAAGDFSVAEPVPPPIERDKPRRRQDRNEKRSDAPAAGHSAEALSNLVMLLPNGSTGPMTPSAQAGALHRRATRQNMPMLVQNVLDGSVSDILHFAATFLAELSLHSAPVFRDAPIEFKTAIRAAYNATVTLRESYTAQWPSRAHRGPTQSVDVAEFAGRGGRGRGRGGRGEGRGRGGRGGRRGRGEGRRQPCGDSDPICPLEETGQ